MGRSSGACLKIISCGRDADVDHEDRQSHERKTSGNQRVWNLRKKSARNQALNNAVGSEAASSVKKEIPGSVDVNFQMQNSDQTVPEKALVIQWKEEKTVFSAQPSSKLSDLMAATAKEDAIGHDSILDESSIIVIQAAVRKFLARKMLLQKKNIIKLQAAVRGYLVRQHAVGTLRCVQAIVKMQALVRARRARLLAEGSDNNEKQIQSNEKSNTIPTVLGSERDGKYTYISMEKLLRNAFAQQLMESTPKSKSINIKCDSSKLDSSWQWLERWMAASAVSSVRARESESAAEQHEKETFRHSDYKEENLLVPSDCSPVSTNFKFSEEQHEKENLSHSDQGGISTNLKSSVEASNEESLNGENLIGCDGDNFDIQASKSISSSSTYTELQRIDKSDVSCDMTELVSMEMKESDSDVDVEVKTLINKDETANECELHDANKLSSELPETETKIISTDGTDTDFVAPQIKLEEMSSPPTSPKLDTPHSQDSEVDYILDKVSTAIDTDHSLRSREIGSADNFISNTSEIPIGGSQCGTEISLLSTSVGSPDGSDVGMNETVQEPKNLIIDSLSRDASGPETNEITSSILAIDQSHTNTNQLERDESINANTVECDKPVSVDTPLHEPAAVPSTPLLGQGLEVSNQVHKSSPESINSNASECEKSVFVVDTPLLEPEALPSTPQLEEGFEEVHKPSPDTSSKNHETIAEPEKAPSNQVSVKHESSPDASLRSHKTTAESEKTPLSQVLSKHKKIRGEKNESSHNIRSLQAAKKSPSHLNRDSTPRTSFDQFPKEQKSEKRRNSFGSSKSEVADQERKDCTSLPNYMQATESAKAKAIASVSPRSSPDMQERDIYMKKRQSLPGTNGNQGSPNTKRSLSQVQQNAKGNGTPSSQERKWRR